WRAAMSTSLRLRLMRFACLLMIGSVVATAAAAREQRLFKSADEAAAALVQAARSNDAPAVLSILGPEGQQVASSGDPAEDKAQRSRFVSAYDARHQLKQSDGKAVLVIGEQEFPFPIPIVRSGDQWKFDTAAGREEMLARRIGDNELSAIQTSLAYYDAQL